MGVLCALVVVKPQELVAGLAGVPLVYIAFGAVVLAVGIDLLRGRLRARLAPQKPFVIAFFLWGLAVTAIKPPDPLGEQALALAILLGLYLAVAVGCGTQRGVATFARVRRLRRARDDRGDPPGLRALGLLPRRRRRPGGKGRAHGSVSRSKRPSASPSACCFSCWSSGPECEAAGPDQAAAFGFLWALR